MLDLPEVQRSTSGFGSSEIEVDLLQHPPSTQPDTFKIFVETGGNLILLQEDFDIAEDVIDGVPKIVTRPGEVCHSLDHTVRDLDNKALIFSKRRGSSTGLVSKSSQPASFAFCSSLDIAWAVSAMMGTWAVAGSART